MMKNINQKSYRYLARVSLLSFAGLFAHGFVNNALAATYAIQFLPDSGYGSLMNDAGDVVGGITKISSCYPRYPSCYTKNTLAVWRHGKAKAIPLPVPDGLPFITVRGMNSAGWIAGTISDQAVVWEPNTTGYTLHNLGLLPGNTIARVAGIDDFNRVVGYNTITDIAAPNAAPFLWDPVNGLSDLTVQGFPNDIPLAISPNGTVALTSSWYQLDLPGKVNLNAPPPPRLNRRSVGGN